MKKHTKFIAYTLAGFMAVSAINVPSVYAEEIPTETVVDTTNNSATDTTTETPTDSTADSSTETPADSAKDESKTDTVKKTTATKKQTVKIKKYKKSKKLYVKKATKAYKVTSAGKLKVAKSLKKSAKVTVVGTSTDKIIKYYAIKSGKSTLLVKQSLLSKTKPNSKPSKPSSKPSTNSSNTTASHPQNNTPSGYTKPKNDNSTKTDKYGNSIPTSIKSVKIVNGKVEYRDVDGKIKYAKYRSEKCNGYVYYDYWYNYREDGMWMPISMTDLTQYPDWAIDNIYEEAHGTIY